MTSSEPGRAYGYRDASPSHSQTYLRAPLEKALASRSWPSPARALDYGCGSGWLADWLAGKGFETVGVDISESGIEVARRSFPNVEFTTDVSAASLRKRGPFDLVTCIHVIAHCFTPSSELKRIHECLRPGGMFLIATPYHGYLKNLAMAVSGHLTRHLDTSWPGAYVHYFFPKSISKLLHEVGFTDIAIARVGRIPPFAKSMIVTCTKPVWCARG